MYSIRKRKRSPVFEALTGLSADEFGNLLDIVEPQFDDAERLRLTSRPRRRALGAGRPHEVDFDQRVFLVATALRHRPKEAVLCRLFGVSAATARRIRRRIEPFVRASPQFATIIDGTAEDRRRQLFEARFELPYFVFCELASCELMSPEELMWPAKFNASTDSRAGRRERPTQRLPMASNELAPATAQ
jgi:hypothetical protein